MRVGILTYWHAHNNGALLQAWALKKVLNTFGAQAEIIPYRYGFEENRASLKINSLIKKLTISGLKQNIHSVIGYLCARRSWNTRCERFDKFIVDYISPDLNEQLDFEEVTHQDYEVYITGSDQVWSSWILERCDPAFFLDFPTNAKKYSYAASMTNPGNNDLIADEEMEYFKKCLSKFDGISVREKKLAVQLEEHINRKIPVLLDPTLLLNRQDYVHFIKLGYELPKKYIFVHYLYEDAIQEQCAAKLAEYLRCEIVELHYRQLERFIGRKNCYANFGPQEFLYAVEHAEAVITNSFHSTVFSILFHKPFYSVYGEDARKNSLLQTLGLSNRHCRKAEDMIFEQVDYDCIDKKLEELRQDSLEFLQDIAKKK